MMNFRSNIWTRLEERIRQRHTSIKMIVLMAASYAVMFLLGLALLQAMTGCSYYDTYTTSGHGICDVDAPIDTAIDSSPDSPPPARFGILVQGQSNAQGKKSCSSVTLATNACDVRTWAREWDRESDAPFDSPSTGPFVWQVDREDVSLSPRAGGDFGVELSMADQLHSAGLQFAIAKSAVGSTAKAIHWWNHCYTSVTAAPDVGCVYKNPGYGIAEPYPSDMPSLRQMTIDMGSKLDAAGFPVTDIVEIQGETDASYSLYSQLYPAPINGYVSHYDQNETEFLQEEHAQWPAARIILVELDSAMVLNRTADLRKAQEAIAARLPYVRLVSSEGIPIDSAHWEGDGIWTEGQRVAAAILGN